MTTSSRVTIFYKQNNRNRQLSSRVPALPGSPLAGRPTTATPTRPRRGGLGGTVEAGPGRTQ